MAKFMVKRSELKNVCKAVNDRKLAELKKEIIEILKKQDEKDFKKATDYLNSQEEHFTHLEKSLSGKWIEKAGYGIGTVRVWKGKKYKKIAPDKWVRVFDKEGRGTNIAIGKLIAKVHKIDNVEDLMAFVMANKQRFVDENGVDLPVLDKLRAAVGVKNENLSGESSSYTYGVGEDVSREKNKIFEGKEKITKEEADLHKVSRKFEQIPTTELKQRKAKLERWIENKTRSKRDSLNNAIFRESYQKELDAINAVLDKRNGNKETSKPAEKVGEGKKLGNSTIKTNNEGKIVDITSTFIEPSRTVRNFKYDKNKLSVDELKNAKVEIDSYIQKLNDEISSLEKIKKDNDLSDKAEKTLDGNIGYYKNYIEAYSRDKADCEKLLEEKKNKPAEKKTSFKQEMNLLYDAQDEAWEGFESGSDIKSSPENSKKFYERVKKFVDDNNIKLSQNHYDELEESNGHSFNEALELAGAYGEEKKEKALAKNREYSKKYKGQILDLSMIDEFKTEEKPADTTDNLSDEKKYKQTKKMLEDSIAEIDRNIRMFDSNPSPNSLKMANQLEKQKAERQKQLDDLESAYKKLNEKSAKSEENKTYWIQDSRGNRLTNEDAKKRIQSNLSKIIELESGDESRKDIKIRDLKLDNEYLKERLNPDDRKEFVSKVKKSLFDGFLGLELLEEDINDEEKDKEEESLWNDYSAEEPDDFNSTELQVREAMNRHFGNCL